MKQLHEILRVKEKTSNVLLLEVIPGNEIDLIANGFDGGERLFRLMFEGGYPQDNNKYYTSFTNDLIAKGTYKWGGGSSTCGSDYWNMQRKKIVEVGEKYFNFKMK